MNKKRMKYKKMHVLYNVILLLGLTFLVTYCLGFSPIKVSAGLEESFMQIQEGDYHNIIYHNKKYVYNPQTTAVLYAGVDSDDELVTYNRYSIAPRADSIELIVLDNYHKVMKILAISRDTITAVERCTMNGSSRGKYDTQLGYAFSYGDGGKASCLNLTQAVSDLLGGVPIHEYAITNNSSVAKLNKAVGGVTVKVPNDDLVADYPELKKDTIVTLDDKNVEAFVRWRDTSIPYSNNGRMERQQAFSSSFLGKFKQEIGNDPNGVWKKIESMSPYLETSITKNQYLNLVDLVNDLTFSETDYYYINGKDVQGEQNDEVYLDKDSLEKMILDLFYLEDGEAEE